MSTHKVFHVTIPDHEAATQEGIDWRIRHAGETLAIAGAYFERDNDNHPVRNDDGSFVVHAPSRNTLTTLMYRFFPHEGLTIVRERDAPGHGIDPSVLRR